jgi:hypothetical protein
MILHATGSSWGYIGVIIAFSAGSKENFNLKTSPQTIMGKCKLLVALTKPTTKYLIVQYAIHLKKTASQEE